jgi:NAD(P)-dependent dehydrogenase (short-subunit alcohol dehydrogenase family)
VSPAFAPNDRYLEGQVAVITGAGRGIGQGAAVALANHGATVVLCSRTTAQLEETAEAIRASKGNVELFSLDVTDWEAADEMVRETERNVGPISLLVNNAGICDALGLVHEVPMQTWWRDIEVNLGGAVNLTRAVLPGMLARAQGRIINVISGAAFNPHPLWSAYCTSKAALHAFTENTSTEIAPKGVQIFSLMPGLVHTALLDRAVDTGIPEVVNQFSKALENERNIPVEQPAEFIARLAAGHADSLSGRFFDANEDFDEVISRAEQILDQNLYVFNAPR